MSKIVLGVICGLVFGIVDVLVMIPLKYENKRKRMEAMSSAFLERFMIGFLIPNIDLGIHPAITGTIVGLGLSLPSAIIIRVYAPIIGIGIIGGVIIGFIANAVLP
jgi:hypothetical protein